MNIDNLKTIHFVGIGGIGISAVAKLVVLQRKKVSGSDIKESETLDELRKLGVRVFIGHNEKNLPPETELLVYSSAVPISNPERTAAKKQGIPQLSYFEFLGEISKTKKTIAISGTHGKSTTTALVGLMLEAGGLNPTVIVGSKVKEFPHQNLLFGKGDYLVVESCEHFKNFLHLHPQYLIINNVELDHTDVYKNLDDVENAFVELTQKILSNGLILINNDSYGANEVLKKIKKIGLSCNIETFGLLEGANWLAYDILSSEGKQIFKIKKEHQFVGEFELHIPGKFNIYNSLAAAAMAMNLGISSGAIKKVLAEFNGIWRRFEKVGEINLETMTLKVQQTHEVLPPAKNTKSNAIIISDYGHHPTAIKETIKAARDFYPTRRIVLVFQPHQHNRTKCLFNEFVEALAEADFLILSEIFDVAGREEAEDKNVSSNELIKAIHQKYPNKSKNFIYGGNLEKTSQEISKNIKPNDLLIIMGAGDIYTIIPKIIYHQMVL